MSLVNTADKQDTIRIEDDSHAVRLLQGLLADECGAAALYSKIIDSLEGRLTDPEVINRLKEIRADEINHAGSLLKCIGLLSPEDMLLYDKGYDGEE